MPRKNIYRRIAIVTGLGTFILGGCVNGSRQLSEMTAQNIHEKLKAGKTSMDEVRQTLGEPQEKGVANDAVLWHYRYQKVSAAFFIPVVNVFAKDANLRGYLSIGFDEKQLVKDVDYHGSK